MNVYISIQKINRISGNMYIREGIRDRKKKNTVRSNVTVLQLVLQKKRCMLKLCLSLLPNPGMSPVHTIIV